MLSDCEHVRVSGNIMSYNYMPRMKSCQVGFQAMTTELFRRAESELIASREFIGLGQHGTAGFFQGIQLPRHGMGQTVAVISVPGRGNLGSTHGDCDDEASSTLSAVVNITGEQDTNGSLLCAHMTFSAIGSSTDPCEVNDRED